LTIISKKCFDDPLDGNTYHDLFENELPKHNECVDSIFGHVPISVVNVNTTSGHVFNDNL
jgi:hypothetical protein